MIRSSHCSRHSLARPLFVAKLPFVFEALPVGSGVGTSAQAAEGKTRLGKDCGRKEIWSKTSETG